MVEYPLKMNINNKNKRYICSKQKYKWPSINCQIRSQWSRHFNWYLSLGFIRWIRCEKSVCEIRAKIDNRATNRTLHWNVLGTKQSDFWWLKFYLIHHYGWWDSVTWKWSRNQDSIIAMGDREFTSFNKISSVPVKYLSIANCFFLDFFGLVYNEFVPTGQTNNQIFYKQILECLREKVRRTKPRAWVVLAIAPWICTSACSS